MKTLNINEAAEYLDVHPNTMRKWDREGYFKAGRKGLNQIFQYEIERLDELKKSWTVDNKD